MSDKMWRTLAVCIVICLFLAVTSGLANTAAMAYSLPWEIIGEKAVEKRLFGFKLVVDPERKLSKDNPIEDQYIHDVAYILEPKEPVLVRLPEDHPSSDQEQVACVMSQRVAGKWQDAGKETLVQRPQGLTLQSGLPSEGLFRLVLTPVPANEKDVESYAVYVIVCRGWKKDLVGYCQELKNAIEQKKDEQWIFASVAVSHVDHVLGLIEKTPFASGRILKGLGNAVVARREYEKKCPDLVVGGLNKCVLRRFAGGPISEFVVRVPADYDPSRKWPVYIHIDPARVGASNYGVSNDWWGNGAHPGMIDVWWHTLSNDNLQWKEYKAFWSILQQKLNVDYDQFQIWGFCGNSAAAMSLALHYPDEWMRANLDLGNSHIYLAGNALNLKMSYWQNSHHGEQEAAAWYGFAHKCLAYHKCMYINNDSGPRESPDLSCLLADKLHAASGLLGPFAGYCEDTATWLESMGDRPKPAGPVRDLRPARVFFTSDSFRSAKAYWVRIDGRVDENFQGTIAASVRGPWVIVKTENVNAYTLDLSTAPVDLSRPVRIVENGRLIAHTQAQAYSRKPDRFKDAKQIKSTQLSGPVWDVFTDPYVVVYGSGGSNADIVKGGQSVAQALANGAPCFDDVTFPRDTMSGQNLVLVGTSQSNRWLAAVDKDLPVRIEGGKVTANGKTYSGDVGYCLIYPSPLHAGGTYVAVFSGTTAKAVGQLATAFNQLRSMPPADVGIFEVTPANEIRWFVAECFDTTWRWHSDWDTVLAHTTSKHSRWQWRQWAADSIRTELGVDAVVCEDHIRSPQVPQEGPLTLRDVFNTFQNRWIVKIQVDGQTFKQMLMTPFTDIARRTVGSPLVLAGVSYSAAPTSQPAGINIQAVRNDRLYTVAMPHNFVSMARLGLRFSNYDVVGEGRLVPMLKRNLLRNAPRDLDKELDAMQNKIY